MSEMYFLDPVKFVAGRSGSDQHHVRNLLALFNDHSTVPFIARYRKELTGNMDEVRISEIRKQYELFLELEKRKHTILDSIRAQGGLTDRLEREITVCEDSTALEDLYLPFKPKRQTRAAKAKERGLEPLAAFLMRQENGDVYRKATSYVGGEVKDEEEALQGARDIIAEWVNENEHARNKVRYYMRGRNARIVSRVVRNKEEEGEKYNDYFEYGEAFNRAPSHRILAIRRGEAEGILKVSVELDDDAALDSLERYFIKRDNDAALQIRTAVKDAYRRLLRPAIETESLALSKQKADEEAIRVFANNLRQLLMASPLGNKRTVAVDPGFRTGCKVVCLDENGNLVHHVNIFPHPPVGRKEEAEAVLYSLVEKYEVEAIAIGNGTAGRETEAFVRNIRFPRKVGIFLVSESGASIYSASRIAREEFPDQDVTVRGAVSIGRRLMDPLVELVKLDPKSIGVGQYQHDVDQTALKEALDNEVVSCVNRVGVNVNIAGKYLLTYVSGLGPSLAENIVGHIRSEGAFRSREELKKVKRMGAKAFEQCAGFLRIEGAENPLDNTSVHPESYYIVEKMAKDLHTGVRHLIGNEELCRKIVPDRYVDDRTGILTVNDIVQELLKPGRDPRSRAKEFAFDEKVKGIEDLEPGMVLPGIITNVTAFGAFVNIGVKQEGLVHISEISDRYVSDPSAVLHVNQEVMVKVIQVDSVRKRISLSIRQAMPA